MDARSVLECWMLTHEALPTDLELRFLARPEVSALGQLRDEAVRAAIGGHRRLSDILLLAEQMSWWFDGERCEEDYQAFCGRCKPHPYPAVVVITEGWGYAFHRNADCEWMHRGQESVARRGGEPAPVERVAIQVALGRGKVPCQACFASN